MDEFCFLPAADEVTSIGFEFELYDEFAELIAGEALRAEIIDGLLLEVVLVFLVHLVKLASPLFEQSLDDVGCHEVVEVDDGFLL